MSMRIGRILRVSSQNRLLADSIGVLGLNVVTICLNFATALVLARILGVREFGAYAFAVAWAMLLGVPALLGLPPLVIRTVASAHVHGDWGRLRGIVRRASHITLATSAITILVAAPVGWLLLGDDFVDAYLIALALVPILGLTSVRQAAMQGLGRVVLGRMPETVIWPGLFLAAVGLWHALGGDLASTQVVGIHVITAAVTLALGTMLLRRSLPAEVRGAAPAYETRAWLRSAFPLALVAGIGVLNAQIGVVLLGLVLGPAATGTFTLASRAANLITFLFTTARYAVSPAVARLHALEQREQLQRTVTRAAQVMFLLTVPVAVATLVFADTVVRFFGSDFADAASALRILCIGQISAVAAGFAGSVLLMTGNEVPMTKAMALGTLVNVALSPLFIVLWGVDGAAIATSAGVVLANIGLALTSWRRARVYSPAFGLSRAFR